ncbi:hypothetical protein [Amycolatopsis sp. NPDC051102]|uniref:hypothetical protein n=1 Tax=Amycolatopsis sp. NPDC051102 TaxID=3155163 RepID=UPI003413022B
MLRTERWRPVRPNPTREIIDERNDFRLVTGAAGTGKSRSLLLSEAGLSALLPNRLLKYTSSERVVLEVDELNVETVADFRALLKLVLDRAGLTCGQIAMKTSINRSSLYNLVDVRRSGLPTKPGQVLSFLYAAGLQLQQVATIMRSWELLNAARPKPTGKPAGATTAPTPASTPITRLSPREIVREATALRGPRIRDVAVGDIGRELMRMRTLLPTLSVVAVLVGWHHLALYLLGSHADVGVWTMLHMSANWFLLTMVGLILSPQVLRWRLRRTVCSRPTAEGKIGLVRLLARRQ